MAGDLRVGAGTNPATIAGLMAACPSEGVGVSPQTSFGLRIQLSDFRRSVAAEAESMDVRRKIVASGVILSSDGEILRYEDSTDVILTIYEADEMGLGRSFPPDPRRGLKDFDIDLPSATFAELWSASAAIHRADLHIEGARDENRAYWIESMELVEVKVADPILTELRGVRERVRSIETILAFLLLVAGVVLGVVLMGRLVSHLHPW